MPSAVESDISDYEKLREMNMKRNALALDKLGIQPLSKNVLPSSRKRPLKKEIPSTPIARRMSLRERKSVVNYTDDLGPGDASEDSSRESTFEYESDEDDAAESATAVRDKPVKQKEKVTFIPPVFSRLV
jgi:hypothetical protein